MNKKAVLISYLFVVAQTIVGDTIGTQEKQSDTNGDTIKLSKSSIDALIVSAYTEAFGKQSDIYKLTPNAIDKLSVALKETKQFVKNNSKVIWMNDHHLMRALDTIESENNKLIDTVKMSRGAADSHEMQTKTTHNFNEIIASIDKVIDKLKKKKYISPKKQKSRDLLLNLASHIRDAAKQSILDRKKRDENKKSQA